MGILDNIKGRIDDVGDKAEDVFEAAKRQAIAAIDDLKEKLDVNDDGEHTVGEVFEAAKNQASSAIEGLKDRVSGDDNTTVGEARVLVDEPAAAASETTAAASDTATESVSDTATAAEAGTSYQPPSTGTV